LGFPSWDITPEDVPASIRKIKRAIRVQIEATSARGQDVWPVIDSADIVAGTVSDEMSVYIKRRGCAAVLSPRVQW
jgi:Protein of unknown function (DUF1479)